MNSHHKVNTHVHPAALLFGACTLGGAAAIAAALGPFQGWLPAPSQERAAPVAARSAADSAVVATGSMDARSGSRSQAFEHFIADLNRAAEAVEQIPAYTAVLERHVFADDRLQDPEFIEMKVRHNPFSVYLDWQQKDQQAIYVEGRYDGRLIVKPAIALPFRDSLQLNPESPLAMRGSRYPITEIGVRRLTERVRSFYEGRTGAALQCTRQQITFDGRPATCYRITFSSPETSPDYSASRLVFDESTQLLVAIENNGWANDFEKGGLVEKYVYHDLNTSYSPAENVFNPKNSDYGFFR